MSTDMKNKFSVATAMMLVLFFPALVLQAQQIPPPPSIRVESALVGVPVVVTDDRGRYVPGLSGADFKLYQDDAPQPFSFFAAADEPIRIGLLLDTSKSTITVLNKIKKAARDFLRNMRPQDQCFVVSFDAEIKYLCPFTTDQRELEDAVRRAKVGGYTGTRMRDAIVEAMHNKLRSTLGRKAIVLLTDGQDFGSEASGAELLNAVAASNTVLYPIHYSVDPRKVMRLFGVRSRLPSYTPGDKHGPYAAWDERADEAAAYLKELSDLSAGSFFSSDVTDLKQTFARVTEELRHQYLLGFYPDKSKLDGKVHSLRVEVSLPNVTIRARRSYRAAR
jgi:Ca-activated chloride channel family protein